MTHKNERKVETHEQQASTADSLPVQQLFRPRFPLVEVVHVVVVPLPDSLCWDDKVDQEIGKHPEEIESKRDTEEIEEA